jgi:hypothetical protein
MSNDYKNLPEIIHNDKLIITTKQLAEFYDTNEDNITANFRRNKNRYEERKHYYKLTGDDLKAFRINVTNCNIDPKANMLYLWTKQGGIS